MVIKFLLTHSQLFFNTNDRPTLPVSTFCTPSAPAIYKFNIPPRWEHIFLHVVSETDNCALMTLEQPEGPFLELDGRNPTGTHFSQTFTMKAGFTLRVNLIFLRAFLASVTKSIIHNLLNFDHFLVIVVSRLPERLSPQILTIRQRH